MEYQELTYDRPLAQQPFRRAPALVVGIGGVDVRIGMDPDGNIEISTQDLNFIPAALSTGGVNVLKVALMRRQVVPFLPADKKPGRKRDGNRSPSP